jgi:EmrB/QacA subfamily drug resistance transporter
MTKDPDRWKALAVVCVAFFITVVDVSIVNVALPSIGRALDFSHDSLQWVLTAYTITFGGFLLFAGRAADVAGRRRAFLVGVALFTLASLACGLAPSAGALVAARAVQGLGAAIISPAALSIVMTTFAEGAERNRALGIWGATGGAGGVVGVLAGGVLTTYLGWEWIFFVNVPVGAAAFLLARRYVRESRSEQARRLDWPGALSVTAALALLVYAVSQAPEHGWRSEWTLARLGSAALMLTVFLVAESRRPDPLMPFRIFRIRAVSAANLAGLLFGAATYSYFFVVTLFVQQVLHWSALMTGLAFVASAGSTVLCAGAAQASVGKIGAKTTLALGFLGSIAAFASYTRVPADATFVRDLLPGYVVIGVAIAFTFVPISIAALAGVAHDDAGLASGLINTMQQVGGAVGIAATSSVLVGRLDRLTGDGRALPQAFAEASHAAFRLMVCVAGAALLVTLVLLPHSRIESGAVPAATEVDDELAWPEQDEAA